MCIYIPTHKYVLRNDNLVNNGQHTIQQWCTKLYRVQSFVFPSDLVIVMK